VKNPGTLALPAAAVCVAGIIGAQMRLTALKDPSWNVENMSFLPGSERIRSCLLGFHTLYADYLWIKTTMYFGGHLITDKQYPYLAGMVDIVSKLNPYFYPAYEFAGVVLPDFESSREKAIVILNRGISHLGATQWKIPFYLGWLYFQYYDDKDKAVEFLSMAARNPKAPVFIAGLAATCYHETDRTAAALEFLAGIYQSSETSSMRAYLEQKLRNYRLPSPVKSLRGE
jgi:hypothetical protein